MVLLKGVRVMSSCLKWSYCNKIQVCSEEEAGIEGGWWVVQNLEGVVSVTDQTCPGLVVCSQCEAYLKESKHKTRIPEVTWIFYVRKSESYFP